MTTHTFEKYVEAYGVGDAHTFDDALDRLCTAIKAMLVDKRQMRSPNNVTILSELDIAGHVADKAQRLKTAAELQRDMETLERYGMKKPDTLNEFKIKQEVYEGFGDCIGWSVMGIMKRLGINEFPLRTDFPLEAELPDFGELE